jgi:hypothetical protein
VNTTELDASATTFLVERYLPTAAISGLTDSVARVAFLCAQSLRDGAGVRYLQSTYLPTEDTCFCLFEATSPDAVRAVNAAGHFVVDRITVAVVILNGADTSSPRADTGSPGDQR